MNFISVPLGARPALSVSSMKYSCRTVLGFSATGLIVGIFLGHAAHKRQRLCSPVTPAILCSSPSSNPFAAGGVFNMLRLRVVVLVAASAALLVALQMSAPLIGLTRDVGTWSWAAG